MFEMRKVGKDPNQNRGRKEVQMRGDTMTRHKINKEDCEYIIYREKGTAKTEGKTYLYMPAGSSITLNDISRFHNATVEQVGVKGVWLRMN
jgi:hypothetical protein